MATDGTTRPWTVTEPYDDYETARERFDWDLPPDYHPAEDLVGKHDPDAVALYQASPDGRRETYTFGDLDAASDRLAAGFAARGVEPGDRVGVVVPQKPATPLTHLAAWKLGAVTLPLSVLFGEDALRYRLDDAGARAVVHDASVRETVAAVRPDLPDLEVAIEVDGPGAGAGPGGVDGARADDAPGPSPPEAFEAVLADHEPGFEIERRGPAVPSVVMYTSGSTGPPKGVHHRHAVWLGRAAAAAAYFEGDLFGDAVTWTPSDWAWGAALGGLLFASWHPGVPGVGAPRESFEPEVAFSLLEEFGVTDAFVPPTALRMLMAVDDPAERYDLDLRVVSAVGEPLTPEILDWADAAFDDLRVNEFYGQTELNLVVATNGRWFERRPGRMGRVLPGYDVAVLDRETREPVAEGEVGELAFRPHDATVFFAGYWNRPEQTAAKRHGEWYLTGDLGRRHPDGALEFVARANDVIITSGYRVGPGEVERVLLDHDAVEQAGVVGVPDDLRGERIRAFVQPAPGVDPDDALREELRDLVRDRLAAYEYPRDLVFAEELPQTTTGKIRRTELRER